MWALIASRKSRLRLSHALVSLLPPPRRPGRRCRAGLPQEAARRVEFASREVDALLLRVCSLDQCLEPGCHPLGVPSEFGDLAREHRRFLFRWCHRLSRQTSTSCRGRANPRSPMLRLLRRVSPILPEDFLSRAWEPGDRRKEPGAEGRVLALDELYARMFTARAATRRTVIAESVDSAAINALAGRVSGIVSVGLNAVAFVSDT